MRALRPLICLAIFLLTQPLFSQDGSVEAAVIGFYNVENLFDTIDNPGTRDAEFTPYGDKAYNSALYQDRLKKLSETIADIAIDIHPEGVQVLGLSEVENKSVIEDLLATDALKDRGYKIIHFESPDRRGIDVGLIYQSSHFRPRSAQAIPYQPIAPDGDTVITRDILWVSGLLDGEMMHFFVNHWPSRRGGAAASAPLRNGAADVIKQITDSLHQVNPMEKIVIMGDMNDDPTSPSIRRHLQAKNKINKLQAGDLYSTMYEHYISGRGTLAWEGAWNIFDQLIVSSGCVTQDDGYRFHSSHIYSRPDMKQKFGPYKGYPNRAFVGDNYLGGYSDHFPVFLVMTR